MVGRIAIEKAILVGVQDANKRYEKWSRGGWVSDSGVEGHVVSTVAEKLHGVVSGMGSIELEVPFGSILESSGAESPPGRPRKNLNARNRADIVILTKKWRPVYIIEIKRSWHETKCLKDLKRIRDLILRCGRQKNGSVGAGFLAFLLEGWETADMTAEQCLKSQVKEISGAIGDRFNEREMNLRCRPGAVRRYPKKYRVLHNQTDCVHAPFCIGLWSG